MLRLFILAGEPSGDRLAAALVRDLEQKVAIDLSGVGGIELEGEGLRSLFPMSELSVMGGADVLRALPRLLRRVRDTAEAILRARPDLVVLVDVQGFSARVAQRLRRSGFDRPILLYVAPAVWAHGAGRARRLRGVIDEVMAVLPFEPKVMQALEGPPTVYVGHAAESLERAPAAPKDTVLLLAGSRRGELQRHLPAFRAVAERLTLRGGVPRLVMPTLPRLADTLASAVSGWAAKVEISSGYEGRAELFARTALAVTKSGTATLELGLQGVPMVIAYALDPFQALVYARKGRPPVGLPNIVLGEQLVPELVRRRLDGAELADLVEHVLDDAGMLEAQCAGFERLRRIMDEGNNGWPRRQPAERVLAHWRGATAG